MQVVWSRCVAQTVPLPKYALPAIQRLFKNSPYGNFFKKYPAKAADLRTAVMQDHEVYQQVSRWLSKGAESEAT